MYTFRKVEVKADLGRKAIGSHVKYMADAVNGYGCDRHLLGNEDKRKINKKRRT